MTPTSIYLSLCRSAGRLASSATVTTVVRTVIIPASSFADNSLKLARLPLEAISRPAASTGLGCCVQCGAPVHDGDPFLRYHGEYYHADKCLESNPPALAQVDTRVRPMSS